VCWQLGPDNLDRELSGLVEAMNFFGVKAASMITYDQSDSFVKDGKTITVQPFHEWAT